MFHKLYKSIVADVCCLCDTDGLSGLDLCHSCHNGLPHNHFCCYKCAAPLAMIIPAGDTVAQTNKVDHRVCGRCLSVSTGVDRSIVPFLYRPPIDFMIKRFKFSEEMKFSRLLGDLLADAVLRQYGVDPGNDAVKSARLPDLILPVPVHKQRLLQRGFNQAEQIARTVAGRVGKPCNTSCVIRTESKLSQSSLSAAQRETNIRRAFEIQNTPLVQGAHLAVVDDVYTTGATARAIARRLKSAGAASVSIWAVARTP